MRAALHVEHQRAAAAEPEAGLPRRHPGHLHLHPARLRHLHHQVGEQLPVGPHPPRRADAAHAPSHAAQPGRVGGRLRAAVGEVEPQLPLLARRQHAPQPGLELPARLAHQCVDLAAVVAELPPAGHPRQDLHVRQVRHPGREHGRRLPHQAPLRERAHVARVDAAAPERLDEGRAVPQVVVAHQVEVGRDQRAQVLAEGDVQRRAVVQRPNAHGEHVAGGLRRLVGKAVHQVGVQLARGELPRAGRGDAQQVGDAGAVHGEKGVEHRRHQDGAARVCLEHRVHVRGVGLQRLPAARRLVHPPQRVAQRAVPARRLAVLLGQLSQQVLRGQVSAGAGDLALEHLGHGEVLEQRHDVRERLVERQHVRVAGLQQQPVHAVQQRVGHLVRDDAVRQAGEHDAAGQHAPRLRGDAREVPEENRLARGAVVRVGGAQRVRVQPKPPDMALPPRFRVVRRPERYAAQRPLEVADGGHGHRVHHLLVELRISLRGLQSVPRQQVGVLQVDGLVEAAAGGVEVHHLHVLAHRPGAQFLPGYLECQAVQHRRLHPRVQAGVERVHAQPPVLRTRGNGAGHRAGSRGLGGFTHAGSPGFARRNWWREGTEGRIGLGQDGATRAR